VGRAIALIGLVLYDPTWNVWANRCQAAKFTLRQLSRRVEVLDEEK